MVELPCGPILSDTAHWATCSSEKFMITSWCKCCGGGKRLTKFCEENRLTSFVLLEHNACAIKACSVSHCSASNFIRAVFLAQMSVDVAYRANISRVTGCFREYSGMFLSGLDHLTGIAS